jgi:hypothetical protein
MYIGTIPKDCKAILHDYLYLCFFFSAPAITLPPKIVGKFQFNFTNKASTALFLAKNTKCTRNTLW